MWRVVRSFSFLSQTSFLHFSAATLQVPAAGTEQVVDYLSLPPPVRYEELQREVMSESLPCTSLQLTRLAVLGK